VESWWSSWFESAFGKCERRGEGGRCKQKIFINNQLMPVDSMIEIYFQPVLLSPPKPNRILKKTVVKKEQEVVIVCIWYSSGKVPSQTPAFSLVRLLHRRFIQVDASSMGQSEISAIWQRRLPLFRQPD
jgi:hypothetical protein